MFNVCVCVREREREGMERRRKAYDTYEADNSSLEHDIIEVEMGENTKNHCYNLHAIVC